MSEEFRFRFVEHVKTIKLPGHNGKKEIQDYVPFSGLSEYWAKPQIRAAFAESNAVDQPNLSIIRKNYLRVFSTLVYIGKLRYLSLFTEHGLNDTRLPFLAYPSDWPDADSLRDMFQSFEAEQWTFFPFQFDHDSLIDRHLALSFILPYEELGVIRIGSRAKVLKIKIHESYNKLCDNPTLPKDHIFALKTYEDDDHRRLYDNERTALTALQADPSDHVVAFHGSFRQNGSLNLLLELVEDGNFLDYLKDTPKPRSTRDVADLWTSVTGILQGFYKLHQLTHHRNAAIILIVHQDVKPDNIFITKDPSSPYKFKAKVADFGCSHAQSSSETGSPDLLGNPTYSAPECSHHTRDLQTGPNVITTGADIWGLGCILSEVAAWIANGKDGLDLYRKWREVEIASNSHFRGSEYSACFHNGATVLRDVSPMHQYIADVIPYDHITIGILNIVEEHMLIANSSDRWQAKKVKAEIEQIIENALAPLVKKPYPPTTEIPSPPTTSHPPVDNPPDSPARPSSSSETVKQPLTSGSHLTRSGSTRDRLTKSLSRFFSNGLSPTITEPPSSPQVYNTESLHNTFLTIPDILRYREFKKGLGPVSPEANTNDFVKKLGMSLSQRDHLFFIDDSYSMQRQHQHVVETFTALSYIAKSIDPDAIELVFASNTKKVHQHKNTSELISILENHSYQQDPGMMESKLSELMQNNIMGRLRRPRLGHYLGTKTPLTVFIFTDGAWGQGAHAAGVQNPIETLGKKLIEYGLSRTQVAIHFIRFGNDEHGKENLRHLDDFGKETFWDIVDTIPWDGNVAKMFIGAISSIFDENDEVTNDSGPH